MVQHETVFFHRLKYATHHSWFFIANKRERKQQYYRHFRMFTKFSLLFFYFLSIFSLGLNAKTLSAKNRHLMERNNRRSLLCICNRKKYLHKNTITAYLLDFRLLPCRIWTGMIIKFSLETFRFTKQKISKLISLEMESSFFMISINMEMLQLLSLLCYPHINELNGHATTIPIAGQFH